MGTAEGSFIEQGDDFTPRIGNDYQALIPPLREGTKLSIEEAEGILPSCCSVIEKHIFLLGLYIFGKNLSLVKRFAGNKNMKEIQVLYYGEFYASDEYRRWSEWGKWRGKRCIYGGKLFTERGLQELLSRLLPCVSKRCQAVLMETSRNFLKGKISFEDYIFELKDSLGVLLLIEAVGIGKKGKENLTSTAFEPISSGKDWSCVTPAEILKSLESFKRLRKARMSARWKEFFWEAVWPRLLTRGWQLQQPKGRRMRRSLNTSLIFLVPTSSKPCTNKFSWRLVKGTHYYASIKNMLQTVASDPSVLALGNEEDNDPNFPKKQACRFLDPNRERSIRNEKTSIVDTSTLHGEEQEKVTELSSLPVQPANLSPPSDICSATEEDGNVYMDTHTDMHRNTADPAPINDEESSSRTEHISDDDEFPSQSNLQGQRDGLEFEVHPRYSSSSTYTEKGGASSDNEGSITENFVHREPSPASRNSSSSNIRRLECYICSPTCGN